VFYRQEYFCEFLESTTGLLRQEDIDSLASPKVPALNLQIPWE
jgi:hypothetical protein